MSSSSSTIESIQRYENGGEKLSQAIRGLTRDDMHAFPVPGTWSIQQIVLHLVDSDLVMADRMKRVIAEDKPSLLAFDEKRWTDGLHYELQNDEDAVTLFALNRRMIGTTLRALPASAFARSGVHSERGPLTLAQLVDSAASHLDHHVKFINDKREKLGKLMW